MVLEGAKIKLYSVATNMLGVLGRAMLEAMVKGKNDPTALTAMAKGRLLKKQEQSDGAGAEGAVRCTSAMAGGVAITPFGFLDQEIANHSEEIIQRMGPFEEAHQFVDTIPGVGRRAAEHILAETGVDMSRLPTVGHFASGAGSVRERTKAQGNERVVPPGRVLRHCDMP